jgi:hypothetical protein
MAYNFAQDPFFNKCQREKCVWQGVTFKGLWKEDRKNEKSDSSSFAELVGLVRMNDQIQFT